MMTLQTLVITIIVITISAKTTSGQNEKTTKKMTDDHIIPKYWNKFPEEKLTIIYPSTKKEIEVAEELTPLQVKDQPEVKWNGNPSTYYTLMMVDPDANVQVIDVKHWLVVNILGSDLSTGEVIAEYLGSGPPKDTGLHRYIFLLYEQDKKIVFDEPKSSKTTRAHRLNFSVDDFKAKYNLKTLFAANYYKAQWGPYVDEFRKQFKD